MDKILDTKGRVVFKKYKDGNWARAYIIDTTGVVYKEQSKGKISKYHKVPDKFAVDKDLRYVLVRPWWEWKELWKKNL